MPCCCCYFSVSVSCLRTSPTLLCLFCKFLRAFACHHFASKMKWTRFLTTRLHCAILLFDFMNNSPSSYNYHSSVPKRMIPCRVKSHLTLLFLTLLATRSINRSTTHAMSQDNSLFSMSGPFPLLASTPRSSQSSSPPSIQMAYCWIKPQPFLVYSRSQ